MKCLIVKVKDRKRTPTYKKMISGKDVYSFPSNLDDAIEYSSWFCQYHLTHFIRTRIMQRERYDHSRAFFELPEAAHRWRCRFFCWPSNSYNISRS